MSRRQFLRIAGVTGASIGVAGGLGGLIAACGGEDTTTTAGPATTAGVTTTAGAVTETTAGSTTTVSAAAEAGREIKVGCVFPKTGPLAAFAGPFDWVKDQWTKALTDGVVAGDGKKHAIKILTQDTQSDTNRCAQVTGDLIQNDKVDIVFAGGAPDTMNPAGDVCEAMGTAGPRTTTFPRRFRGPSGGDCPAFCRPARAVVTDGRTATVYPRTGQTERTEPCTY